MLLTCPKYLKWHMVVGAVFGMIFLVALRNMHSTYQYRLSMVFFFFSGLGLEYMTVVIYVTAPMTTHKRDMGLICGLVSAYSGLTFAVIRECCEETAYGYISLLMILS